MNLSLADPIILSGLLKLSPVEAKMKMEGGGVLRQGLRLGEQKEYYDMSYHVTIT